MCFFEVLESQALARIVGIFYFLKGGKMKLLFSVLTAFGISSMAVADDHGNLAKLEFDTNVVSQSTAAYKVTPAAGTASEWEEVSMNQPHTELDLAIIMDKIVVRLNLHSFENKDINQDTLVENNPLKVGYMVMPNFEAGLVIGSSSFERDKLIGADATVAVGKGKSENASYGIYGIYELALSGQYVDFSFGYTSTNLGVDWKGAATSLKTTHELTSMTLGVDYVRNICDNVSYVAGLHHRTLSGEETESKTKLDYSFTDLNLLGFRFNF